MWFFVVVAAEATTHCRKQIESRALVPNSKRALRRPGSKARAPKPVAIAAMQRPRTPSAKTNMREFIASVYVRLFCTLMTFRN